VIAARAATFARPALSADFAWQRFNGTKLRFMVSTHPWTAWAHQKLAFVKSVPPDMIDAIKQGIPNALPNGANPLVVPVPEVRAAIVAVLQGGNAEKVANDAQRQVLQILKG
jgi:hypothetical protein